jgi:hypothetical protein
VHAAASGRARRSGRAVRRAVVRYRAGVQARRRAGDRPPWPTAPSRSRPGDKLFGPGNAYVATAKQLVAAMPGGPAIDLPAGPSEVLVIADAGADPEFIAADLLSQAEHGTDSQVLLVTDAADLIPLVQSALERQWRRCRVAIFVGPRWRTPA